MPLPYNKEHKVRARELRKALTPEEQTFWSHVRRTQIFGLQFYRQRPIGQYIVDFYCPRVHLVIEIDGTQHRNPDHAEADRVRDEALEQLGIEILRFSNKEIQQQLETTIKKVRDVIQKQLRKQKITS